eukprot:TRINITY_DN2903_c0_g2_i1.p2 TRINITY_DN2903_c0_g2~~TRINITY_DN2903_c0_g2_i1.p2  ORF type:complete len:486 (-),score=120.90 TRINITY_DN2903_c0_g2_i1:315-1772(-)
MRNLVAGITLAAVAAVAATTDHPKPTNTNTNGTAAALLAADGKPGLAPRFRKSLMNRVMPLMIESYEKCKLEHMCPYVAPAIRGAAEACQNGKAGEHPCRNVDLLSFVPLSELGSADRSNDIWGWEDPVTGKEIAITGCADGTSFVDVSDPVNPKVIAWLPTHTETRIWRDIKVYKDHAFIVSEAPRHGMQVVDLTQFRNPEALAKKGGNRTAAGIPIPDSVHYGKFGQCHNIAINEETGFAYAIGSTASGTGYSICAGGPHIIDIRDPKNPQFAGCFGGDGYTHDSQCVVYNGPDAAFKGREICFHFNEDTLTIVDATDKANNVILSRTDYDNNWYTHQGWLTEDHQYVLMDDELDELRTTTKNTRTLVWDVRSLRNPQKISQCLSNFKSIDHNLYIRDGLAYLSNYASGLMIYDVRSVASGQLTEMGFFDVAPQYQEVVDFHGSWSNYPYFKSGIVVATSMERGLYVLKYNPTEAPRPLACSK